MSNPIVSVIVPCYNQAQYLDECLQSVLDQTYATWECIIVNDGSPDNTNEVLQKWLRKDARFKYLEKENGGLSSARNYGIDSAQGTWILPLDADDRISADYMALAEAQFAKGYSIIYCRAEFFGRHGGIWNLAPYSLFELAKSNIIFCTAFYKKADWYRVGGYDTSLVYGFEDWDFWISILEHGEAKVFRLDQICFYYRVKEVSMLNDLYKENNKREKTLLYIEDKHLSFFRQHLGGLIGNVQARYEGEKRLVRLASRYKRLEWLFRKIGRGVS